MAAIVNGRHIILYKHDDDTNTDIPFACSTSCDFNIETSEQEVTNINSAYWRDFKPDVSEWSVSCGGFIILNNQWNYLEQFNQILTRETFLAKFVIDDNGSLAIVSGNVFVKSLQLAAPDGQPGTYSNKLRGRGEPSIAGAVVTPSGIIISSTTVQAATYSATGGETSFAMNPSQVGKQCLYISRGGVTVDDIITSGTPNANQVKFDTVTGLITPGTPTVAGEYWRGLFQ